MLTVALGTKLPGQQGGPAIVLEQRHIARSAQLTVIPISKPAHTYVPIPTVIYFRVLIGTAHRIPHTLICSVSQRECGIEGTR